MPIDLGDVRAEIARLPLIRELVEARKEADLRERRAFIIEFAGMPKAGKSSAIENLRHFFSHGPKRLEPAVQDQWKLQHGYKVHTPAEGVSLRTPNYLKSNRIDYNCWAGAYATQELLQANHEHHYDIVILDRGPWDAGCWLRYALEVEMGSTADDDAIATFFQLPRWIKLSDLHVVLTVDPPTAQERERQARLIPHAGPASDLALMRRMREIYNERFDQLEREKRAACEQLDVPCALKMDTTNTSHKELALQIIRAALDVAAAKVARRKLVPVSAQEINELLEPYTRKMKPEGKKRIKEALPRLLEVINRDSASRGLFRVKAREIALDPHITLLNRAEPDEIVKNLYKLAGGKNHAS